MYASTTVTKGRVALNSERPSMQAASSLRSHRVLPQGGAPRHPADLRNGFRVVVEQIMGRHGLKDVPVKRSSMDDTPDR